MEKYQVFISFRGDDTRSGFISHFHSRLCQKKIETYIDHRLDKGEEISPALLSAIGASKVSVVVSSENYACSSWCLDELVDILLCRESGQVVVPVFYGVDPSHVRKQSGSYGAALARLEGRFEEEVIRKWRDALTDAANIAGWDSKLYRLESEFVDAIVEDILQRLSTASSSHDDSKNLIGIEQNVELVNSLLSIHAPKVLTVGIWGMGGMGKTTLARFVFKILSPQFEGSCFLANVREEFEKQTSDEFERRLVSELLEENDLKMVTLFHKDRLRRKRVLIVLDDVNDSEHLELLAGEDDWFGLGSRLIVTTRDAELLRNRADEIFELKGLNFDNALKLFRFNAFKRSSPTPDDIKLSEKVVNYVGGVPLALKVLGSFLRSKRREQWDHELDKLKEVPNKKIYNALKISFDGLDEKEQHIFLDIACCINGHVSRNSVECILGGSDSFADIGIDSLIDKSLISVEDNALIVMHDLVREMGQESVRQQCVEEPGKRSRIWGTKDVSHVFENSTGTAEIEGISLDMYEPISKVELSPIFYKGMYKLRLLNLDTRYSEVKLPQGLLYLPNTLSCLLWSSWPLKYIPAHFEPRKLVVLKMPWSRLEQLWSGVHDLANLRYIDLSYSRYLTEFPDLSLARNLESVNLRNCGSLRRFRSPLRFRVVDNVASLNQCRFKCNDWTCWTLGSLDLTNCSRLENFPEISGTVEELSCGSSPDCFDFLHQSCCITSQFPYEIGHLASLEKLTLSNSVFTNIPGNINQLRSLVALEIENCEYLKSLPALPLSLQFLNASCCVNLEKISDSSFELALRWRNNNSPKHKQFLYHDCLKLDRNMCNIVVTEFQIRSLHTAAISTSKHNELKVADYAHVWVSYPGKKIPKWFDSQSEAHSLDVALPSSWHNDGFLGVAVCAIVSGRVVGVFEETTWLSCSICVKTNQGESFSYTSKFAGIHPRIGLFHMYGNSYRSDNLFMWYKYENYLNWRDATHLSLKFDLRDTDDVEVASCSVTSCGIHLLNLQDVEEFGIKTDQCDIP